MKSSKPSKRGAYKPKPWRDRVIKLIAQGATITTAAEATGVDPRTVRLARDENPDFGKQLAEAHTQKYDRLEAEVFNRANHGVDEPVIHQGQMCFTLVDDKGQHWPTMILDQMPKRKDGTPILPKGWEMKPLVLRKPSDGLAKFILQTQRAAAYGPKMHLTSDGSFKEEQVVLVIDPPEPKDEDAP